MQIMEQARRPQEGGAMSSRLPEQKGPQAAPFYDGLPEKATGSFKKATNRQKYVLSPAIPAVPALTGLQFFDIIPKSKPPEKE